jgi:hypothetical protein
MAQELKVVAIPPSEVSKWLARFVMLQLIAQLYSSFTAWSTLLLESSLQGLPS